MYTKCIEDLPNELLSRILAFLSLDHDLDSVQHVSKRWYAVVDETIGREIAVTSLKSDDQENTNSEFPCIRHAHLGCFGLDMLSKIGVKTCYVDLTFCDSNFSTSTKEKEHDSNDTTTNFKEELYKYFFKHPHLLKHLYFKCCMRSDLFKCLMKDVENLALLQINMLALSQLQPFDLKNLRLPQLKALVVTKCLKALGLTFDDTLGLPNLIVLLQESKFPKIRQLDIRFPVKHFTDFGTVKAILKFISVHIMIKELYIIMEFPVEVKTRGGFQEELTDLIDFSKRNGNCKSLKICEIQGVRLHASYPQLQIWLAFLKEQQTLKSLTLRLGFLPSSFLDTICARNKESLDDLYLYKLNEIIDDGGGTVQTILDCKVFSSANLKTLFALGCDVINNVRSLPKSLSMLFLSGLISSEEVEHILFSLHELKFVNLKNACLGKQAGFGVTLNHLRKLVKTRKVRRLVLNGSSLADDYPPEGICNEDPKTPVQLMKFDNWDLEHMYLDWELNKDMYYEDKCYGLN